MELLKLIIFFKNDRTECNVPIKEMNYLDLSTTIKNYYDCKNDIEIFVQQLNGDNILLTENNIKDYCNGNVDIIVLRIYENIPLEKEINGIYTDLIETKYSKFNKNDFINEKCCKCQESLSVSKYLCNVCDGNVVFCDLCEGQHEHPMIYYKNNNLADSVQDIMTYMSLARGKTSLHSMFSSHIELESLATVNPLFVQINEKFDIIVNIKWNNYSLKDNVLIIKNYNDLDLSYKIADVLPEEKSLYNSVLTITICGNKLKQYQIVIYYYNPQQNTFSKSLLINLTINDDKKNHDLYTYFKEYPQIMYLPKEHKEQIHKVYEDKLSNKTIAEIYDILKKRKWSIPNALDELLK